MQRDEEKAAMGVAAEGALKATECASHIAPDGPQGKWPSFVEFLLIADALRDRNNWVTRGQGFIRQLLKLIHEGRIKPPGSYADLQALVSGPFVDGQLAADAGIVWNAYEFARRAINEYRGRGK